jgi:hypothetical protein
VLHYPWTLVRGEKIFAIVADTAFVRKYVKAYVIGKV